MAACRIFRLATFSQMNFLSIITWLASLVNGNYVHIPKGCVHGNNIVKYSSKSVDECVRLCNARSDCLGFEYGVSYGGAGVYQPQDCQLQSSANYDGCDGAWFNLDFYIKGYLHIPEGCVHGNNIVKYSSKSVDWCMAACDALSYCLGFEYGVSYGGAGSYQPQDCQLQSSANYDGCDGAWFNLDFYVKGSITANPTLSPTPKPTSIPTPNPTPSPSSAPTDIPTRGPTSNPTTNPTLNPSSHPTESQTNAPTEMNGYLHIPKGCVHGNNIVKYSSKSVDWCMAECDAISYCLGFEYGVSYGGAGSYQPEDCQLQSSANYDGCDGSWFNLDFYMKTYPSINPTPNPSNAPTEMKGYLYIPRGCVHGNNIVKYSSKSVDWCMAACEEISYCLGFEYGVSYGGAGSYQPGDCQLQSSANYDGCDGAWFNLDFYMKHSC